MSLFDSSPQVPAAGAGAVPFSLDDLARLFDAKTMQRGRTLALSGAVTLGSCVDRIEGTVSDLGRSLSVLVTPVQGSRRIVFDRNCSCGRNACAHMVALTMAAHDTLPQWRSSSLFDLMDKGDGAPAPSARRLPVAAPPSSEPKRPAIRRVHWTLEPGKDDVAIFVSAGLGADGSEVEAVTPRDVLALAPRDVEGDIDRTIARLLGGGGVVRTPVPKGQGDAVDRILRRLLGTGRLRWRTGPILKEGATQTIRAFRDPTTRKLRPSGLPVGGVLIKGQAYWCIDPGSATASPIELQVIEVPKPKAAATPAVPAVKPAPPPSQTAQREREQALMAASFATASPRPGADATILERPPKIVVRLGRVVSPSDGLVDVLRLSFDYGEEGEPAEIEPDDQRQFAKVDDGFGGAQFVRRDKTVEQAALARLAGFGFAQARVEPPKGSIDTRGTRIHWLSGRDTEERWAKFVNIEVPKLIAEGWTVDIGADFGTRMVEAGDEVAVAVRDAGDGWFDLEVGVEIDGARRPLLPILARLVERGGMEATRVIDGRAHIVLDDGSVLALPADRVQRLMSVLEAMLDSGRRVEDKLQVPMGEADNLLDIDDLIAHRPDEAAQIEAYLRTVREAELPPEIDPPASFQGELRDYQRVGLAWMQNLRASKVAGILADDMGLGKTAQTLAHIALEHQEGRLTDPCLVVVPTSLVPNWVSEAKRFVPHLSVLVLHGVDRHEKRDEVHRAHIVVATYGVVARDMDLMKGMVWHLVVLDEAQAIKNPDSKATRAVCSLNARHRLCLSGTPVENNLGELWSQFAFLMPGLLGDRKDFHKRFRTPIEKRGDTTRANLLVRRTRPFLLRRTKQEVAKELPPKTEVVVRIDLDQAQRDLYETIRLSVHETVRAALAVSGMARNTITVIDALLKLRQVCCDPRLVKIPTAAGVTESGKLGRLVEMVGEMVPEGRRILIFSQFTSMLNLIKKELEAAGIDYVELTGSTMDRATPVERFQRGEVPVFLISLKAGGRGLNLTAADTVIHYDPWWNPAAEDQATDRAYRIGQDKPVFVYKLIASNTVEERILDLQRRKGNLSAATIEGTGLLSALNGGDIDFLFGGDSEDGPAGDEQGDA